MVKGAGIGSEQVVACGGEFQCYYSIGVTDLTGSDWSRKCQVPEDSSVMEYDVMV